MSNYRTAARKFVQASYGGYCNLVRAQCLEPIPFVKFTEVLKSLSHLSKKERNVKYIEVTRTEGHNVRR